MCYPKKIIDSKFENNKCYFLVQWKRFKENTWEPEENISHRVDLIEECSILTKNQDILEIFYDTTVLS